MARLTDNLADETALRQGFFDDEATEPWKEPSAPLARGSRPPFPVGREEPPPPPRSFGDYVAVRRIASGGMGTVYEARHRRLGRRVAVKCMHPKLLDRPHLVQRFLGEAVAAAQVRHPGVVEVLDYGHDERGAAYLVMEYLDGESLAGRLGERGLLSVAEIADIGGQIAKTAGAAHDAGIVHRDLKPDNVFLLPDPAAPCGYRVKILDFGVAKFLREEHAGPYTTRLGKLLGTPWYMSPEQCAASGSIDARSDVYSLGCVLYQLACGRPPFPGPLGPVLSAHLYERPAPPRALRPDLPAWLEQLILQMMKKRPEERPASMGEVARTLAAGEVGPRSEGSPAGSTVETDRVERLPCRKWRLFGLSLFAAAMAGLLAAAVWL